MRKLKFLTCLLLASTLLVGCKEGGDKEPSNNEELQDGTLIYKTVDVTQKVTLNQDISALQTKSVDIYGAKGETDSGQFVVRCDENVRNYDISISDFVSGENKIAKEKVEISKQMYAYCDDVRHDGALPKGYYPDALIPLSYVKEFKEDTFNKGENQGFWLDVAIPLDAKAGVYTAEITMNYNEEGSIKIPVSLTVFDFELEQVPYFQTTFGIFNSTLAPQDTWLPMGELDGTDEMYMNYFKFLLKYNVNTGLPSSTIEKYVGYMREYYDKLTCLRLPEKSLSTTQNDWAFQEELMRAVLDACIEDNRNYFEKAFYRLSMMYDEYQIFEWREPLVEPTIKGCDEIEEKLIKEYVEAGKITDDGEIATSLRGLRHCQTAWWDEKYGEEFTMCCPLYPEFWYTSSLQEAKDLTATNDVQWWSYGCVMSDYYPSPTWQIDDYMVNTREMLWFNYENDILGNLFWSVNGYCNWQKVNSDFNVYYLWDDLYTTGSHDNLSNGDGYLLYPGAPYGSNTPFASIRLASFRDAIDDHTYMSQLGETYSKMERYGAGYDVQDCKSVVALMNDQMWGRNTSKLQYGAVLENKNTLAQLIVLAEKNDFVIDELTVNGNDIEYSFYGKSGETVKLNGAALSGVASGEGLHYTGKVAIQEDKKLVIEVNGTKVTLISPPQATTVSNFEAQADIDTNMSVRYASTDRLSLNTDEAYSVSGNSVKVVLGGSTVNPSSHKPEFSFKYGSMPDLIDLYSIEFDVYNPSNKDLTVTVFLEGVNEDGVKETATYDKYTLKAGAWTKIEITNCNVISTDSTKWAQYQTNFGLKCDNLLDNDDNPYEVTLYVDNLLYRAK